MQAMPRMTTLLIGTRKGAFRLGPDGVSDPILLGNIIHHVVQDRRDPGKFAMACKAGHLGPTVYRSDDGARTWKEASKPPAFHKAAEGEKGLSVGHVFWLTPGHASEPGAWYAGTSPQGLFRSEDGGDTWAGVDGFNRHPMRSAWVGDEQAVPPDGATLHSINVDPRDPKHMYFGMSAGGVFESTDGGADWKPLNRGCSAEFLPSPDAEYGHDPHCVRLHPLNPDRLYQQNHCGVYRMDRAEARWVRIGDNLPREIGDIGFPVVLHPRDPDTAWVFPMDGTMVWPRTSPGGKPAVYKTTDAGGAWTRQDRGLPSANAWFTVKRQAMTAVGSDPVSLYFGTTQGEIWCSRDEGENWTCLARHLPHIYSVETAELDG